MKGYITCKWGEEAQRRVPGWSQNPPVKGYITCKWGEEAERRVPGRSQNPPVKGYITCKWGEEAQRWVPRRSQNPPVKGYVTCKWGGGGRGGWGAALRLPLVAKIVNNWMLEAPYIPAYIKFVVVKTACIM